MTTPLSDERIAEMRSRLSQTEPLYYCQLTGSEVHSLLDEVERQRQAMAWDDDLRDELHECCANLREYEAEVARLRDRNAELVAVLRSVEWEGRDADDDGKPIETCPACRWWKTQGHHPQCALDAALRGADE